jgi:hypothetical protein
MRHLILPSIVLTGLLLPAGASAQTRVYDWADDTAPALVTARGAAVFIHKDGTPFRTYAFSPNARKGDADVVVADADGDDALEVVATGKPTFSLDTSTEPRWFMAKGCKGATLGDFMADGKLALACAKGRSISVYTHDLQFAWKLDPGRSVKSCVAGDLNNDGRDDLECAIGKGRYVHVDGEGKLLSADVDEPSLSEGSEPFSRVTPPPAGLPSDLHDFDGDGTAEESLAVDGTLVSVVSKASPKALVTIDLGAAPESALVKDLDGDGKLEVVVASSKLIAVLRPGDKKAQAFPLSPKKYKRAPVADLTNVYANNFTDDAAAQQAIRDIQPALAKCYASRARKSGLTGSGQLLMQVFVTDAGKIKQVSKLHSDIPDKKVVACVKKALGKTKPPKAAEGAEGSINITLAFSFRDFAK